MKKTFDVLYYSQRSGEERQFSHKYSENWAKTPLYCPGCGATEVWCSGGGGDYYVGEQHICTGCGSMFYLPNGLSAANGDQDAQRLKQLITGAAAPA